MPPVISCPKNFNASESEFHGTPDVTKDSVISERNYEKAPLDHRNEELEEIIEEGAAVDLDDVLSESNQNFEEIKARCLAEGKLFEDPEFPADDCSLYYKEGPDISITWLRPKDLIDNPQFIVEGVSRFDVDQGYLGDCWLLASIANLTMHKKLFFQVVPADQSFEEDYAGVFHFRFWQYGRWVDVVIDDYLPTHNGKLLYLHSSDKNEFWSPLFEKAYAKLNGSYEALKGGWPSEAMEDFTGGVVQRYFMSELPPDFHTILLKAYERNSLMAGAIVRQSAEADARKKKMGLISGHAYSISCVKYVDIESPKRPNKVLLIRIRNPWGNSVEWQGAWSDVSKKWRLISEAEKVELGLTFDADGEFWMTYSDFIANFFEVEICNLTPTTLDTEDYTKKWELSVFEGEWVKGKSAGGRSAYDLQSFCQNPQYTITLEDVDEGDDEDTCTVIVALMQKNRRSQRHLGVKYLNIGFEVYRLPNDEQVPKTLDMQFFAENRSEGKSKHFLPLREVTTRFDLEPGTYVIVPCTFTPDQEGEFMLRVFSEKANNMVERIDNNIDVGDEENGISS